MPTRRPPIVACIGRKTFMAVIVWARSGVQRRCRGRCGRSFEGVNNGQRHGGWALFADAYVRYQRLFATKGRTYVVTMVSAT
eukprot:scaffold119710_cov63-Phaeocystis_antarctica.AAC.8